jgi:hypothetical protein
MGNPALRANKVYLELTVLKGTLVIQALKAFKANREQMVRKGFKVNKEYRVNPVQIRQ